MSMKLETMPSIEAIAAEDWDALVGDYPFQSHAFFLALERTACVGKGTGWQPIYFVIRQDDELIATAACFIKAHSMGEFVYDMGWAREAERYGIRYYPKLVAASPFSPVTGPRLHAKTPALQGALARAIVDVAERLGCAGAHVLFPSPSEEENIRNEYQSFARRTHFQYQWFNQGYASFDDFLQALRSRRRKEIRRERNSIANAGIHVEAKIGGSLTADEIQRVAQLYRITCDRFAWGGAYLSDEFFHEFIRLAPDKVVFFDAQREGETIAGAFCVRAQTRLYGRYWGSFHDVPNLHFETCFYRPIEWAIEQGIEVFEPGAGGEHKFARGFMPTLTSSLHRHFHPGFHDAIDRFCGEESAIVEREIDHLSSLESPYKRDPR